MIRRVTRKPKDVGEYVSFCYANDEWIIMTMRGLVQVGSYTELQEEINDIRSHNQPIK